MTLEEKYEALLSCVKRVIPMMEEAAEDLGGIKGTRLRIWAKTLRDHVPEENLEINDEVSIQFPVH